ncbi:hypothetical protein CMI46_02155 [Candidatus Pacearchaeota archaeon]|nr:hypothetical protein [Candidatus Pacearchaeota archaeon]|tara:strand:- start:6919 stop:8751 length:1833 start_codon:yes stop_codon:yes gene_type:complete
MNKKAVSEIILVLIGIFIVLIIFVTALAYFLIFTNTCKENWECNEWEECIEEEQTRNCNDLNQCGTEETKPELVKHCVIICEENWQCGEWEECIDNYQIRECTDLNNCDTQETKPNEIQDCNFNKEETLLIFADDLTFSELEFEINRLKEDIEDSLSYKVSIMDKTWNNPKEIREIILDDYEINDLKGIILIGDIPPVYYDNTLSDFYYMDLGPKVDECYNDGKVNYVDCLKPYPQPIFYPYLEIYSGRLKPSKNNSEGIEQLRDYLNRNHDYRDGKTSFIEAGVFVDPPILFERKRPVSECKNHLTNMALNSSLYSRDQLKIICNNTAQSVKKEYIYSLSQPYEFTFLNTHGGKNTQIFYSGGALLSESVEEESPQGMIYEFATCNNGHFLTEEYMAGAYLYSGNALILVANTVPTFITTNEKFLNNVGQFRLGVPIGEVYRREMSDLVTHLFGDPTLIIRNADLENSPQLEVDSFSVDLGEQNIGTETETPMKIRNIGKEDLILDFSHSRIIVKKDNQLFLGFYPFYYDFRDSTPNQIKISPNTEKEITLKFNLKIENAAPYMDPERAYIDEGEYVGQFINIRTNDPRNPWITINVFGKVNGSYYYEP